MVEDMDDSGDENDQSLTTQRRFRAWRDSVLVVRHQGSKIAGGSSP